MKKGIIFGFFLFLGLFFASKVVFAITRVGAQFLGGKIVSSKALEIQALEMSGFTCVVPGSSITISPMGSLSTPTSYFIPPFLNSNSGNPLRSSQFILGKYSGKEAITCTSRTIPPVVKTVWLDTIVLFGNSR